MFKVFLEGRRNKLPKVLRNTFSTYDEARAAVRRHLIMLWKRNSVGRTPHDSRNRTMTIGKYGYSISAVQ